MAYPFTPMPTVDDFCAALESRYGCVVTTKKLAIQSDKSVDRHSIKIIRNTIDGGTVRKAVIPPIDGGSTLCPTMLRSICFRLKIDPKDFGFELG